MTTYGAPICMYCTRLRPLDPRDPTMRCDAFPDGAGIPDAILHSDADHREPFYGDHGLRFKAKTPAGETQAARIIAQANTLRAQAEAQQPDFGDNSWLYGWGDLPTTLAGLRAYLKDHHVSVETFKNTGRYEANYDRYPWLADL